MKIYISADMEGVTGVTDVDDVDPAKKEASYFKEQMSAEVVAACQGALAAGASEIWVKDAHWSGRNLDARKFPKEVKMIHGWSGHPLNMMECLNESFHAVLLVGYHSPASSGANPLSHTLSGKKIAEIHINRQLASEFLVSTFTALYLDVPVAFVAGDEGLCQEVKKFNETIETVATFKGIGGATVSIHPELSCQKICEGVKRSLKKNLRDYLKPLPSEFHVEITFKSPQVAYSSSFFPGCQLIADNKISFEHKDFFEVLRMLKFITS